MAELDFAAEPLRTVAVEVLATAVGSVGLLATTRAGWKLTGGSANFGVVGVEFAGAAELPPRRRNPNKNTSPTATNGSHGGSGWVGVS